MKQPMRSQRNGFVDSIIRNARSFKIDSNLPGTRASLLGAYFADVPEEDVQFRDLKQLAGAALTHIASGRSRKRRTTIVSVFNPTPSTHGWSSDATIIQLVNKDMPFLVDSVTMALNRLGHGVQLLIHPILGAKRSRSGVLEELVPLRGNNGHPAESFIYIEITKVADGEVLRALERTLKNVLADVRAAVEDWQPMLTKLRSASQELRVNAPARAELLDESSEFLQWLADDNFTLLGYQEYQLIRGKRGDRLRSVKGSELGICRDDPKAPAQLVVLNPHATKIGRSPTPLVITKTDASSTIHRSGHLDLIGVKIFGPNGKPKAVKRFVGLFTSTAYNERPGDIPLVRLKIEKVMRRSALDPTSHSGKALQHILNTFPRDDLFQGSSRDLARISEGILNLQERHKLRLFCRRDAFNRFFSCFVYLPRDQYSAATRRRIERVLLEELEGTSIETKVTMSESALARLEATVRVPHDEKVAPKIAALEAKLAKVAETWRDRFRAVLLDRFGPNDGIQLFHRFAEQFPAAYEEQVDPEKAGVEIEKIAAVLDGDIALEMTLRRKTSEDSHRLCFTTMRLGEPIQLYSALPILEHMGTKVLSERLYEIKSGDQCLWVQEFDLEPASGKPLDPDVAEDRFLECFRRVLAGDAENDQFNSFIIVAGLDWREAALLRAYCKYLLQTKLTFSQSYMQEVLGRYPILTNALVALFRSLLDPELKDRQRQLQSQEHKRTISSRLDRVETLDEDRIVRAFISVVEATLRTNFFQTASDREKPYISFKLDSSAVAELPDPRPMVEIFVYSPRFEGVHLRCGSVARGGLRWSDRREDFRTEILGLMKAQQVKNTVIVPAGAKGGFVCKQLPESGAERMQQAVDCYKNFIRGLLDLTDNIDRDRIVAPEAVVRRDDDDPYLVVAADKGTATFSDHANSVATEYGFWLGDAFASGGSAGYDHKKMGITARGAWECVKRHFRELGVDTQKQTFSAAGIGDMSGDVFGNGMLMSRQLRLVAAFNHRHIFLDPDPDTALSYRERRRLFRKGGAGWDAYNQKLLSAGGGIFSRNIKTIELSRAAQNMLQLTTESVTPPELIRAILRMKVDLLWNGGIGTYIKSSKEAHANVGDPGNDTVRVNADELQCKVIGEGGNLGITQLGRIEFASRAGRINTDFIDNSGGVDTSDREVNIKILLERVIATRALSRTKRDALLAKMTDEIATLVLENSYQQSQTLSVMDSINSKRLGENVYVIRALEARGLVNRELEFLPSDEEISERRKNRRGLTRPELAVILSYSKINCFDSLIATNAPEDPYFEVELHNYFPAPLRQRFKKAIQNHRLRREIIAMRVASDMINRMGASFVIRAEEDTGSTAAQVARAYAIACEIFQVRYLCKTIEARDNQAPASVQYELLFQISRRLRHAIYWILNRHPKLDSIDVSISRFGSGVAEARRALLSRAHNPDRRREDATQMQRLGVPGRIAEPLAALAAATQVLDIIEIGTDSRVSKAQVASTYFELGERLRLDWIRNKIESLQVDGRWPATARATLREHLAEQQNRLLRKILRNRGKKSPRAALADWLAASQEDIERAKRTFKDMESSGILDFATLSVALREIERLD
jgi:glutamate dehydrogenase